MKDNYFDRFQKLCIRILAQSDNCQESQDMFRAARNVPELVTAWQHFWAGILHEVPEQVIKAFAKLYPVYRDDIIRAGVYYNEAPPVGSPASMILVGDSTPASSIAGDGIADSASSAPAGSASGDNSQLAIAGRHRIYVLGDMPVLAGEDTNIHINTDRANVTLTKNARCSIEKGSVIARDRAIVSGKGHITCYDSTTIRIYGGHVFDHGHLDIRAYNDASVHSFTNRRITLNDNATLYYDI